ncbi:MAG TPA: carbon-nitrogen hydrolase family protein [Sneathiellales bacterium]|nr:carbon-nitrogen hydrolase family protein [Sneathiellales bacterium]
MEKACSWIDRAAEEHIELLVFPEWFHPGIELFVLAKKPEARYEHIMGEFRAQLTAVPGPATDRIAQKAREHGMHVVYGMIELLPGGQMANSSVLFGPDGAILNVHRKTVLTPGLETPELTPGDELNVTSTALGEIGQLICADASLPESPRVLAIKGADIICHSMGSFYVDDPDKKYVVRDITLRSHCSPSRAIDNNVFVVVANLVGMHGGLEFYGKSRIMDPQGEIIAEGQEDVSSEELVIADIDLTKREEGHLPFRLIDRRRPELYGELLSPNSDSGGLVWHDTAQDKRSEEAAE